MRSFERHRSPSDQYQSLALFLQVQNLSFHHLGRLHASLGLVYTQAQCLFLLEPFPSMLSRARIHSTAEWGML